MSMTLGIYKPGQGYWVRVMTATIIAVITMAAAAWLWDQVSVVATKLPTTTYAMNLQGIQGVVPAAGQTVDLYKAPERGQHNAEKLGTGAVESYIPSSSEARIGKIQLTNPVNSPSDVGEVRSPESAAVFNAVVAKGVRGVPYVEPMLLQGGVVAIVLILGSFMAWYFCATRPGTVEFLISTDMEMKKVNWSTRREILGSTWVVIAAAVLIAGALFGVDVLFQAFFKAIGVLGSK